PRYGGEEFVVVMPGAGQAHALETAQAIRAAIEAAGMAHEASGVAPVVTVSVGVAWGVPTPTDARELLVQQADTALYAAKAQGRNRVVCAERG
ncbi:MAG: GGDEF domain-containing protein, partial [Burkholderiaceae bacterium]|nr:GGDEF domain-containing protein [Burkholderiaceae bacterium]